MSEQSSPPDSMVQSAIINSSCRLWRALSCRGSTTSAKQATNSSTGRPQRCIARRDASHAPLHRNARVHAPVLTQVSYAIALHVPYRGTGPAITELLAGNVQIAIDTLSVLIPHARSGVLRALAVSTPQRSP